MKMKTCLLGTTLAASALFAGSPASAQTTTNTFDADQQGWGVGNIDSTAIATRSGNAPYVTTGGNPGGYIFTNDTEGSIAFIAPTAFTGLLSRSNGGQLTYDLYDADGNDRINYPAVVIYGANGTTIGYNYAPPSTSFSSFVVPLTAAGWTLYAGGGNPGSIPVTSDMFAAVLANPTTLAILADWHSGGDSTGLDNVAISSSVAGAVPEPASWAMMIVGFGLIGAGKRYRQRRTVLRYA